MTTIDNNDDKTDVNIHTNTINNNTTITPPLQQPNLDKKRKMGETGPEGERLLVGPGTLCCAAMGDAMGDSMGDAMGDACVLPASELFIQLLNKLLAHQLLS